MEATSTVSNVDTTVTSDPVECRHHWIVETLAIQNRFPAVCTRCGATREFPAEPEDGRVEQLDWSELWARW